VIVVSEVQEPLRLLQREVLEGPRRYSSTLSLTLELQGRAVSARPRLRYCQERIDQEAGWAPRPVWTGSEILALTGIRSIDCPTRNESL
jgi:hypothetical protein